MHPHARRATPVAAALLVFLAAASPVSAQPQNVRTVGEYLPGNYGANNLPLTLIAVEFEGEFTHANASKAFKVGQDHALRNRVTATIRDVQVRQLAANRHLVLGWTTEKGSGFVAVAYVNKNQSTYIMNSGETNTADGWRTPFWEVNGARVKIQFGHDHNGGIAWKYHKP